MLQPATHHHRRFACLLLVLAAFLFVCPARAHAIPVSEYQQKLKQATTALETLVQIDENETEEGFYERIERTIEAVRVAVPEHLTVEAQADVYNVDNSFLHKNLEELKQFAAKHRANFEKIEDVVERVNYIIATLRELAARIADREFATNRTESKEQEKTRLEGILARPEYAAGARGPNALTRLVQDFLRWLQKLFPKRTANPGSANTISLIVRIVVIVVAAVVLIYAGFTFLRRFGRTRKAKGPKRRGPRIVLGEQLEPEATATDLLSQAETLARNGDLRAAIRKAYIALLVELGDRKMISLAQHKTNRDYLNSVRNVPPLHATMRGLTDSFERHWYGFEQATPDDWQDFRAGYSAALQAEH